MLELWVPILGYEDLYSISDAGRVQRLKTRGGRPTSRILRYGYRRGYACVSLSRESVIKQFSVHRLMWMSFFEAIPDGMQINHKNGNKADNRLPNLELCTPSENTRHALDILGHKNTPPPHVPGEKNGRALITEEQVREIRRRYAAKEMTQQKLADLYGVDQTGISAIVLRKSWRHIA